MTDLLNATLEAARVAGNVAMKYFTRDISIEIKRDGSPVSEADRAAEQAARKWIAERFPGESVSGEELGVVNTGSSRRWIIDPIDGTRSFVHGVPLWGSLVAVAERGSVVAGAVVFPVLHEWTAAQEGEGCWSNGARVSVSRCGELSQSVVLTTDSRFATSPGRAERWTRLAGRSAVSRTWGDCYGYHLVATGRAECMVDDVMNEWDWAPFVPIIAEAGGVLTDWSGGMSQLARGVIATNALLANAIRDQLITGGQTAELIPQAGSAR
jgi:histidinol phosphatase-like enzyme (inositol monophosphatase family)